MIDFDVNILYYTSYRSELSNLSKGKKMSKSYVNLQPVIASIMAKYATAKAARLAEQDCHIETPRNLDLDIADADYCGCSINMIEALKDIVNKNKEGSIHSDYQEDVKHIESFLERLEVDESVIQANNEKAKCVRDNVIAKFDEERDAEIADLLGNNKLFYVSVKTGKLSEEQVKVVNALLNEKGFLGVKVQRTNWSSFVGFSEGSADELHEKIIKEIIAGVPSTTKNFIGQKIAVSETRLINYFS